MNFETNLGRIVCEYDEKKDKFIKYRITNYTKSNEAGEEEFELTYLDDNNHLDLNHVRYESRERLNKKTFLKSEGFVSISSIIAIANEFKEIKDILVIFFKNNKVSGVPEFNQPTVVARQGIDNIFAEMAGDNLVGMSVSIDTLPAGYSLSDFMVNQKVISSKMIHVYKTDIAKDIAYILERNTDEYKQILKDLYDHEVYAYESIQLNTDDHKDKCDDCINGYCNSLRKFLVESDFMTDFYNTIGIVKVDFKIISGKQISNDDIMFLNAVCAIHIDKAAALKFDYDVDINSIKMKYIIAIDIDQELFFIPYTSSPDEIDTSELYKLTIESTNKLQERLSKIVKAYDASKGIKSGTLDEML